MPRNRLCFTVILGIVALGGRSIGADPPAGAQWIWSNETADGPRWFRREVRAYEPSTGILWVAASAKFEAYVNGQLVGKGEPARAYRYSLNGIAERGMNSIAIKVDAAAAPSGVLIHGNIRGQGGSSIPFDSGQEWKCTTRPPANDLWTKPFFDATNWQPVKQLGLHADSPWKSIAFGGGLYDRFNLAEGFAIERIAEPSLTGSLTSLAWGNRGRLLVTREREPIFSLIDENGDGKYEKAVPLSDKIRNCQGVCQIGNQVYACGDGPDGAGLYRLTDADGDDAAEKIELIHKYKGGMGDHGPHTVVQGPDGRLYNIVGNHCWIQSAPAGNSPILRYEEGELLRPRYEDPNGHASGIKAPGGTIWQFTPDGKTWRLHSMGFRNAYDLCFDSFGNLFSYDSDMEWEVGMPFYKPTRLTHCVAGADFGWRSNSAKWPQYYFDSLPSLYDVGRGSPTGVVVYEHHQLPTRFHGAILACDWSMGRLHAVRLKNHGATHSAEIETIATGNPLNIVDIEVDRDGSLVFATGGRGTEGGVYRIRWAGGDSIPPVARSMKAETVDDALAMPQIQSQWAKEACAAIAARSGEEWGKALRRAVENGAPEKKIRALTLMNWFGPAPAAETFLAACRDADPGVRAFGLACLDLAHRGTALAEVERCLADADAAVRRVACEALVRLEFSRDRKADDLQSVADGLWRLADDGDRWVRYAARVALERLPNPRPPASAGPKARAIGMLVSCRIGKPPAPGNVLADVVRALDQPKFSREDKLDLIRALQLSLIADAERKDQGALKNHELTARFPTGDVDIDRELARVIAYGNQPEAVGALLEAMAPQSANAKSKPADQETQIHYALCLSYVKTGWDAESARRLVDWYERTRPWEGGHSFTQYLERIVGNCIVSFPKPVLRTLVGEWRQRPFAARVLIGKLSPEMVDRYDELLEQVVADLERIADAGQREEYCTMVLEALGRSPAEKAQAILRRYFDEQPERRDQIARLLARHPAPASRDYYLRALQSGDNATAQECIKALRSDRDFKPKPEELRTIILAGLRLGQSGGMNAAALLQRVTGAKHGMERNAEKALAFYQDWYRKKHPNAVPAELPPSSESPGYSVEQLLAVLDGEAGRTANADRGKAVFTKANCVKCHRFGSEGQGVGPDLTSVRRRFNRKEILEAVLFPSRVISDQYKSVTVSVNDGRVYSGMALSAPGAPTLVLLLSDATKVEIPAADIESTRTSAVSVMPEGAFKPLSVNEIADLFAYFETGKSLPETPASAAGR